MKVVLQRVQFGCITVDDHQVAKIDHGVVILIGIGHGDGEAEARYLVEKIANLRIFEDEQGKMNRSVLDVRGSALVVSQFTLFADTRKGRRPSFTNAAHPDTARPLVDHFVSLLAEQGVPTQTGEFGAHMLVEIHNDGPVTIIMER